METTESQKSPVVERENPLRQEKWRKLDELKTLGIDPFPHNYERTHTDSLVATTNWILAYLLSD